MSDDPNKPSPETDEVYELHYSVLVPRIEKDENENIKEKNADYFRYGTPNTEKNYNKKTESIEENATNVVEQWFPEAGGPGIMDYTTQDKTSVASENSYEYVKDGAFFYFGEKHEIVGDENKVDGVRKLAGPTDEVLCYEIGATMDFEAAAATRLEFDANVTSAFKAGAEIEAKYGLAFESGLTASVALKSEKAFEFSAGGGFESGMGEYVHQEEFAFIGDEKLLLSIVPDGIADIATSKVLKGLYITLIGLTHTANASFAAFGIYSIAAMGSIQEDASNIDMPVRAMQGISGVQALLGAIWIVIGIIHEKRIRGWLHHQPVNRTTPFIEIDKHQGITIGTGLGAAITLNRGNVLINGDSLRFITNPNGDVTIRGTQGTARISADTSLDLNSGGPIDIDGVGITSNSNGQPWTHTGAFTAGGNITLGQVTAQSVNVAGTPVATTNDVAHASDTLKSNIQLSVVLTELDEAPEAKLATLLEQLMIL